MVKPITLRNKIISITTLPVRSGSLIEPSKLPENGFTDFLRKLYGHDPDVQISHEGRKERPFLH